MLSSLRGPSGEPAPHVRLLAAVLIVGLLALVAPLFVVPVLRWAFDLIF